MLGFKMTLTFVFFQAVIILYPDAVSTRNRIVRVDGSGDAPTIQAAIDSSSTGDTISIMAGEYDQECIRCEKDSLTIIGVSGAKNTILRNTVGPPGIMSIGKLFQSHRHIRIKGMTIKDSRLALYVRFYKDVIIEECIFHGNSLYALVLEVVSDAQVIHNLFYGNQGGMNLCGTATIAYNTICDNSADAICIMDPNAFNIYNNIVCNNDVGISDASGHATYLCNNVYGNNINCRGIADPTGRDGNISVPPEFCAVDPASTGYYHLQSDSPCAPGNHPDGYACGLIGAYPVGCGATDIREESWGAIKAKFK